MPWPHQSYVVIVFAANKCLVVYTALEYVVNF